MTTIIIIRKYDSTNDLYSEYIDLLLQLLKLHLSNTLLIDYNESVSSVMFD